jgi:Zn-dependent protease with chaperone function
MTVFMKRTLCFLLVAISFPAFKAYSQAPCLRDSSDETTLSYFTANYKAQVLASEKAETLDQRKYITQQFKDRFEDEKSLLSNGQLLFNSPVQKLLDEMLAEVIQKNGLGLNCRIFLTDETVPNAYATGDGNLFVTVGLIERLHSKEELYFVICHELSHEIRNHVNKSIYHSAGWLFDKQLEKELKTISKDKVKTYSKMENVIYSRVANARKFGRSHEYEADSLGFNFYRTFNFSSEHVTNLLSTLDGIDQELHDNSISLQAICAKAKVTVKPSWIMQKTTSSLGFTEYEKFVLPDSLKTHPNIPDRISKIAEGKSDLADVNSIIITDEFNDVREMCLKESIFSWFTTGNLGRAFFRSAQYVHYDTSSYSNSMISITLSHMAIALRARELGYRLSQENIEYDPNYNECLHFLNQLSSAEMAELAFNYTREATSDELANLNEFAVYARAISAFVKGDQSESKVWSEYYLEKFPKGNFTGYIRILINNK